MTRAPSAPHHRVASITGARLVAGLQLRRRFRDRSALIQGIVAPIVLAVIIATAFGGGRDVSLTIGVVDLDGGAIGAELTTGSPATSGTEVSDTGPSAQARSSVELVAIPDVNAARDAIGNGDVPAAIVIPAGFADSLAGTPLDVAVLVDPGRQLPSDVAVSIANRLAATVDASRIVVTTAVTADATLAVDPGLDVLTAEASEVQAPMVLGASAFGEGFDPITYFAPSMAILFAFLTLGAGARTLIVERREGTLARIRSTPVSDRAVLAGVTGSVVVLGFVSFLTVWLVTAVVFGADWGDPLGVLAVILATVVSVAGISLLVAGLARTEAQADGISSVLAFGFALIGGGFLSPGDLPDVLARIALITPNRWALDAFAELGAGATGVSTVLVPITVLTAIGVASGAIGLGRARLGAA